MAQRSNLLMVDYHTDCETGMYDIGEVDYGISGTLDGFLKRYGRKGKDDVIKTLAFLIHRVEKAYSKIRKETNKESAGVSSPKKPSPFGDVKKLATRMRKGELYTDISRE